MSRYWYHPDTGQHAVVSDIISLMSCIKGYKPTSLKKPPSIKSLTKTNLRFYMLNNMARTKNFGVFLKLIRLVLKSFCCETTSNHLLAIGCHNVYAISRKRQICLIFLNFVFFTVMGNDSMSQATTKSGISG